MVKFIFTKKRWKVVKLEFQEYPSCATSHSNTVAIVLNPSFLIKICVFWKVKSWIFGPEDVSEIRGRYHGNVILTYSQKKPKEFFIFLALVFWVKAS